MLEVIMLFVLFTFAAIGMVSIMYIIDELKEERKTKRKEKFKQDVLEVIHELEEDKNA